MKIQSLSIVVPGGCPNNCKFCVSKMREEVYINQIENNMRFTHLYKSDYKKRLSFARDNGCNTVILTGNGEPLSNMHFLDNFGDWNLSLSKPFHWIEIQTSGVNLDDEKLRFLRNHVGVTTISLSLSNIFDSVKNAEINQTVKGKEIDIEHLCSEIKRYDFNLRLSLNINDSMIPQSLKSQKDYEQIIIRIFDAANHLNANQITFRKLYTSGLNTQQDEWIQCHTVQSNFWKHLNNYIRENSRQLEILPFGAMRFSIHKMSIVVDDDCMSVAAKDTLKYLILRPNCKLYTKWDDQGSLLF